MKTGLDKAIDQIGLIQGAIERAQGKWEGLSRMLIAYGWMRLFLYALQSSRIFLPNSRPFYITEIAVEIALYVALFVCFVLLYRKERNTADQYYLGCLNLFGFIVFAFQFSFYFVVLFEQTQKIEIKTQNMMLMQDQAAIANMLLFCLCAVVCGLIRGHRGVMVAPALLLLLYLFLSVPFRDAGFSVPLLNITKAGIPVFTFCGLYYCLVTSVGYVVVGHLLKRRGRCADGDQ